MQKLFLFLFLSLFFTPIFAQFANGFSFGTDYSYGKLLKHSAKQTFPVNEPCTAFSIEGMKQTNGKGYWSGLRKYPRVGFSLIYKQYGNDTLLGSALGFFPQLDLFMLRKGKWNIFTRLGYGIAYLNRPYDRLTNTENTAIGSHLNNYTTLGLCAEYKINPYFFVRLGGFVAHSSNGHTRTPNLGLNTATLRVGVHYMLKPAEKPVAFPYEKYPIHKKPIFGLRMGIGMTEVSSVPDGPIYPVYVYSPYLIFNQSGKSRWWTGMEFSFDRSVKDWAKNQEVELNTQEVKYKRFTVYGAHEFMFGRIGVLTELQVYADKVPTNRNFWAAKIGPNVYLLRPHKSQRRNLYAGIYLKAEYFIAQYVEGTMGLTF